MRSDDLKAEVDSLRQALTESLEQQAATSEILQVISSSPSNVQPVFETILDNATRLCEAQRGAVFLLTVRPTMPPPSGVPLRRSSSTTCAFRSDQDRTRRWPGSSGSSARCTSKTCSQMQRSARATRCVERSLSSKACERSCR
jgi:hypothetical protein